MDIVCAPDRRPVASITLIPNLVHAPGVRQSVARGAEGKIV